jgi:CheY-like chemotaxis protein
VQNLCRLAHDLRAPLHAILGFTQRVQDGTAGPLTRMQEQYLGHVLVAARRLAQILSAALAERPSRSTVLLVEDDAAACASHAAQLDEAGYAVETAGTGTDAVERCQCRSFDAVALQLLLPDMSGWDALRRIRASVLNSATHALAWGAAESELDPVALVDQRLPGPEALPTALAAAGVVPTNRAPGGAP